MVVLFRLACLVAHDVLPAPGQLSRLGVIVILRSLARRVRQVSFPIVTIYPAIIAIIDRETRSTRQSRADRAIRIAIAGVSF